MKNLSNRLILMESAIILLFLFAFYITGVFSSEFLINSMFITLFITLFIFRGNNIRYMYFGFIFLLISVLADVFGFDKFLYIASSLSLSFLILGTVNLLMFRK